MVESHRLQWHYDKNHEVKMARLGRKTMSTTWLSRSKDGGTIEGAAHFYVVRAQ